MFQLVGFRKVDYISKKTNKAVKGYTLYLIDLSNNSSIQGHETLNLYVPDSLGFVPSLSSGNDKLNILFNRFGGVDSVVKA